LPDSTLGLVLEELLKLYVM